MNVIGRPREYSEERYLTPEIIRESSEGWMRYRKKEIEFGGFKEVEQIKNVPIKEHVVEEESIEDSSVDSHDIILKYIRENDSGKGVEIEEIIKNSSLNDAEKIVENMLKEGDVFENIPGKLKVLE